MLFLGSCALENPPSYNMLFFAMMMFSKLPLFAIVSLLSFAASQDVFTFINPPPSGAAGDFSHNLHFPQNSVQNITWSTTIEWISLILVQNNNADPDGSHTLLRRPFHENQTGPPLFPPLQPAMLTRISTSREREQPQRL